MISRPGGINILLFVILFCIWICINRQGEAHFSIHHLTHSSLSLMSSCLLLDKGCASFYWALGLRHVTCTLALETSWLGFVLGLFCRDRIYHCTYWTSSKESVAGLFPSLGFPRINSCVSCSWCVCIDYFLVPAVDIFSVWLFNDVNGIIIIEE